MIKRWRDIEGDTRGTPGQKSVEKRTENVEEMEQVDDVVNTWRIWIGFRSRRLLCTIPNF